MSSDHELVSSLCLPTVSYRKRKQTRFVSILWAVILIVSAQITFAGVHAQSDASGVPLAVPQSEVARVEQILNKYVALMTNQHQLWAAAGQKRADVFIRITENQILVYEMHLQSSTGISATAPEEGRFARIRRSNLCRISDYRGLS